MRCLLDSGVLLRMFDASDPHRPEILASLKLMFRLKYRPAIATQNAVEFWNVMTRPALEVLRHQPKYVLISSWNEFAENVSIEDATEYGSQYRTLTKGYIAAAQRKPLDCFVYTIEGTRVSNKRINGRWRRTTPPRGAKTNIVIPNGHFPAL